MNDDDTATLDDSASDADFGAGFSSREGKPTENAPTKEKPTLAATPRAEAKPAPEYVRITKSDWSDVQAAARRTASHEQNFSKLFGTTGNITKLLNEMRSQTPNGRKVAIPKEAFAEMERDFPELAHQTRTALEAALSGMSGTGSGEADTSHFEAMLKAHTDKAEIAKLDGDFPDWRALVGAVDISVQQPDKENPFRKWLASKSQAYQAQINGSEAPREIRHAIRTFQAEAKAAPAQNSTTPRSDARADRIRAAVQPKGDNAGASSGKSDDNDFEAGFASR